MRARWLGGFLIVLGVADLMGGSLLVLRAWASSDDWSWRPLLPGILCAGTGVLLVALGAWRWAAGAVTARSTAATFLTPPEEERVLQAIESFEKRTSGEIRVHLAQTASTELMESARIAFERLGLTATRERNGVLFYVAVQEHRFAVLGDSGIDAKVGAGFWDEVVRGVHDRFAAGAFADGLVQGIAQAGEALATHFPPRPGDVNELPNALSRE